MQEFREYLKRHEHGNELVDISAGRHFRCNNKIDDQMTFHLLGKCVRFGCTPSSCIYAKMFSSFWTSCQRQADN